MQKNLPEWNVANARELLRRGRSVLDTALDARLSGPGRLHDPCVSLEAASPGELKSGGEGWKMTAGFAESPFGTCFIGESPHGICRIAFVNSDKDNTAMTALQQDWPRAKLRWDDSAAARLATGIFRRSAPSGARPALRAFVKGTAFQVRVWRALLQIPCGALVTYGRLASAVGQPAAARAVGTAVGRNPLGYLIPCHRVIRETGALGEYGWGRDRKHAMLSWENSLSVTVEPSGKPFPQVTASPRRAPM